MHMRDRGAALILTILIALAILGSATMAAIPMIDTLVDRQRAHSAADASALAGVDGGQAASTAVAAANGAVLLAWARDGRRVTVTVQVGDQQITARATDEP